MTRDHRPRLRRPSPVPITLRPRGSQHHLGGRASPRRSRPTRRPPTRPPSRSTWAATGVAAGSYTLQVVGTSGTQTYTANLPLTVTGAATTLLVDDDYSDNNDDPTERQRDPIAVGHAVRRSLLANEAIAVQHLRRARRPRRRPPRRPPRPTSRATRRSSGTPGRPTTASTSRSRRPSRRSSRPGSTRGTTRCCCSRRTSYYDLGRLDWDGSTPETNTFLASYVGAIGGAADDGEAPQRHVQRDRRDGDAVRRRDLPRHHGLAAQQHGRRHQPGDRDRHAGHGEPRNPNATLGAPIAVRDRGGAQDGRAAAHTSTVVYAGLPIENVPMTGGDQQQRRTVLPRGARLRRDLRRSRVPRRRARRAPSARWPSRWGRGRPGSLAARARPRWSRDLHLVDGIFLIGHWTRCCTGRIWLCVGARRV